MTEPGRKSSYRVVQWATGNIGSRTLRGAAEHPQLEVVGVLVHSADKSGLDAGELCGLAPLGVPATTEAGRCARAQAGLRALHAA